VKDYPLPEKFNILPGEVLIYIDFELILETLDQFAHQTFLDLYAEMSNQQSEMNQDSLQKQLSECENEIVFRSRETVIMCKKITTVRQQLFLKFNQ